MARLIDADALKTLFDERYDDALVQFYTRANIGHWESYSIGINWGRNTIADAPTVDAVEVVRCRECKHSDETECPKGKLWCPRMCTYVKGNEFCSRGERKHNA